MTTLNSILILAVTTGAATILNTDTMKKEIKTSESAIAWTGKKVLGSHNGSIGFKSGYLEMDDEQIKGGEFVVDMTSIKVLDLTGESKDQLEGHLNSDDFFGVANYEEAVLSIKSASKSGNTYEVEGELTIKGTTLPIAFDLTFNGDTATTTLTVNRTKYGIRYGSGSFFDNLGDNTIRDNFTLDVTLKF